MLEVKNVGYWYDREENYLFKNVNLSFEAGKIYSVLGTSGSGKTTFLSLLAGLDQPKEGEITFKDKSLKQIGLTNFRRKDVSIVFQAYNLFTYMSAYQNVYTALSVSGEKRRNEKEYIIENLKSVGLTEELIHKKVTQLSGGQQQRVAIVRAMATGHDLIVADEPTGNLDDGTSVEIIKLFQKIAHEQNKTVILVTHDQEVGNASDVIYELKNKKFEQK
jgi:putative ABC transport system ATP-binding protein